MVMILLEAIILHLNFEANFPNFFPEKSNAEIGLFLDAGNVWGVDYSDAIDDSNKLRSTVGNTTSYHQLGHYHLFFLKI